MSFKPLALGLAAALALAAPAGAADLANGGFEQGLTGWTASPGFVDVVTSAIDATGGDPLFGGETFMPTGGGQFAQLTAGVGVGLYSVLSQDFTLDAASTVSGDAAFLAFDYLPHNDDAYVKIVGSNGDDALFASDVLTVGDYGHTNWTHFTSGVLAAGSYTLLAGVRNVGDNNSNYSSELLVDSFAVSAAAVPEPETWALMILGFGAAGAVLRRQRGRPAVPAARA